MEHACEVPGCGSSGWPGAHWPTTTGESARRTALAARLGTELAQVYLPPEYDDESAGMNVLTGYGNYPSLTAAWFYALADVPGVSLRHVTDAAEQQDIAFTFPSQDGVTAILVNERLLTAGTVQYEGYVRDGQQTLLLDQAPVPGPGVRP